MAEPARKLDNENQPLSAQEWANQHSGSKPMADQPANPKPDAPSALEQAGDRWGNAAIIQGGGGGSKETSGPEFSPTGNPVDQDYRRKFNREEATAPDETAAQLAAAESGSAPHSYKRTKHPTNDAERAAISDNETSAGDIPYTQAPGKRRQKKGLKGMATKRAKLAIAGAIVSTVVTVMMYFAILPLKLVSVAENWQDRIFGVGQSAVEERTDRLIGRYVRKYVLPSLNDTTCPSTRVSRSCVSNVPGGNNPASKLFRSWREGNFENRLANDYGIEFFKDGTGPKIRLAGAPDGLDISDFANGSSDNLFDAQELRGRNEIRNAYKSAIRDETKLKELWLRFKAGSLLEKKYGVKRCIFACKIRDNLDDWKDNKKSAFKRMLIRRVVEPNSKKYAAIFECILGFDCHERNKDPGRPSDTNAQDKTNKAMAALLSQFDSDTVDEIISSSDEMLEKGVFRYFVEKAIADLFGDTAGKLAGKAIPIVGWIQLAVTIYTVAQNAPEVIAAARFAIVASSMLPFFYALLSTAGEMKSGRADPEIIEGAMETLNPTEMNLQGAEVSPLFNKIMGGEQAPAVSFFSGAAYAAGDDYPSFETLKCSDGEPIKEGMLVCEEDTLGLDNEMLESMNSFFNDLGVVNAIANGWNTIYQNTMGKLEELVGGWIADLLTSIPGLQAMVDWFSDKINPFVEFMLKKVFNLPDVDEMSGGRAFNFASGGAVVGSVESAKEGIGGMELNKEQLAAISKDLTDQKNYEFSQKSLYARFFDADESKSFVRQTAVVMPGNHYDLRDAALAFVANPLSPLTTTVAAATSNPTIAQSSQFHTQTYDAFDAFDMKPIGIALDDPVLNNDPEDESLYGEEACKAEDERWLEFNETNYRVDERTQYAYPKSVNRCRLEETVVCALGAIYAEKLTEVCEEGNQSGSSGDTGSSTDEPSGPLPDGAVSAEDISQTQGCGGISGGVHNSILQQVEALCAAAAADGVNLTGSGWRDSSRQIELRRAHCGESQYAIYEMPASQCRPPTARPGTSMHEKGLAIDFSGISECPARQGGSCAAPGNQKWEWLHANASKYGLQQLDSEAWHWSVNGR